MTAQYQAKEEFDPRLLEAVSEATRGETAPQPAPATASEASAQTVAPKEKGEPKQTTEGPKAEEPKEADASDRADTAGSTAKP